jgi:hypothetical protein
MTCITAQNISRVLLREYAKELANTKNPHNYTGCHKNSTTLGTIMNSAHEHKTPTLPDNNRAYNVCHIKPYKRKYKPDEKQFLHHTFDVYSMSRKRSHA